ncbi:MAG: hypothetical protein GEU94_01510 [Micromonosporaceae bacterium]|nr:hypothetical protein [Micromonosporaceae bacterium]
MRRMPGGLFAQAMLIAMVVEVVGMALTMAANFVTDSAAQTWQFVLVPSLALVIVGAKAGITAMIKSTGERQQQPEIPGQQPGPGWRQPRPGWQQPERPQPRPRRVGIPLAAGLLVLLVFCGGGGLAAMYGVGYGYGWVTGNEDGENWLVARASGETGPLTLTVREVTVTRHFTKVAVTAKHSNDMSISLSLYQNCRLVAANGRTLEPDNLRSDWSEDVAPGVAQAGVITFPGRLPEGAATLSFARVWPLQRGAIAVPIRIRAPAASSALPA